MKLVDSLRAVQLFMSWPADLRDACISLHKSGGIVAPPVVGEVTAPKRLSDAGKRPRRKKRYFTQDETRKLVSEFHNVFLQNRGTDRISMPLKTAKRLAREFGGGAKSDSLRAKYKRWLKSEDCVVFANAKVLEEG